MEQLLQTLQKINWDFSDYNSAKYPLDINSIPWYPATFIPPIPKFLIALLTKPGDTVLDPFGGKGTTAVESVKQARIPIYNDLNPFAAEITTALFEGVSLAIENPEFLIDEEIRIQRYAVAEAATKDFADRHGINKDVFKWYDGKSIAELFSIMNLMQEERSSSQSIYKVRKLAFTSILKQASSQPGHFTYITDNCKPATLVYKDAKKFYIDKINQLRLASLDLVKQFQFTNPTTMLQEVLAKATIHTGDARKLQWVPDNSVNLVLTSPPYLCAQDYIKTMRLTNLFFPNRVGFEETPQDEIGPRNKRRSKSETVVAEFYKDLNLVFSEVDRVLVPGGYFCLVIGQGKSKVASAYDTVSDLCRDIEALYNFRKIHRVTRKIGNRVIQVGGVDKEDIIVFQKIN